MVCIMNVYVLYYEGLACSISPRTTVLRGWCQFKRCANARRLRFPLRRILPSITYLPSNVSPYIYPVCHALVRHRLSCGYLLLCTILEISCHSLSSCYNQHYRGYRPSGGLASTARRHKTPDVDFFCSQWMPPGRPQYVCRC